jgi:hypothetical protein
MPPPVQRPAISTQAAEAVLIDRALADAIDALSIPALAFGVDLHRGKLPTLETENTLAAMRFDASGHITLLYNRKWLASVIRRHGYDAAVGIFAHEIGHLLDFVANLPTSELSADSWAGCAIAVRRGDLDGLVALVSSWPADDNHPIGTERAKSIQEGYGMCVAMFP